MVLVGESSVGKSSFMKRALSGKFALDIPASVGKAVIFWIVLINVYRVSHSNMICRSGFLQVDCGGRWKTCAATDMGYSRSRKVSVTLVVVSVLKINELWGQYVAVNGESACLSPLKSSVKRQSSRFNGLSTFQAPPMDLRCWSKEREIPEAEIRFLCRVTEFSLTDCGELRVELLHIKKSAEVVQIFDEDAFLDASHVAGGDLVANPELPGNTL